jgi:hypothetical protein
MRFRWRFDCHLPTLRGRLAEAMTGSRQFLARSVTAKQ